nr:RNA-dependent RNA polymerase [Flumine sobemo-like virus 12]
MIFQAGRFDVGAPDPSMEAQEKALKYIEEVYPKTPVIDWTDEGLLRSIRRVIQSGCINREASPGIPYSQLAEDNGVLLDNHRDFLEKACLERLKLWRDTPNSQVREFTEIEMVLFGFADPIRDHVKQEPHTTEKVNTGRMRIISGMSIVHQICERVLHTAQNNIEILNWEKINSMIGIGFTDRQNRVVYKIFVELMRKFKLIGTDVSGWDWSVRKWMFTFLVRVRIMLCNAAGTPAENMYLNWVFTLQRKIFSLTNGRFFVTIVQDIIMTSGSLSLGLATP